MQLEKRCLHTLWWLIIKRIILLILDIDEKLEQIVLNSQSTIFFYTLQYSSFNDGDVINPMSYLTYGLQGQTTAPGTLCPTLFKQCVGSFTSHISVYNAELQEGATALSSLSEKTRESNHFQM